LSAAGPGAGAPTEPGAAAAVARAGTLRVAAAAGLLVLLAVLLVTSSLGKRLVYDEYDNLAYGYRLLTRGPVPPQSGQRMPVLVFNALPCAAEECRIRPLESDEVGRLRVRLPTMAFALLLGLVVLRLAGELFGPDAGLLALLLYVTNPSFLAHGKQVTSDVQTAFFATLALWAWWRLVTGWDPAWRGLVLTAVAAAGAVLSKYTSVLLFPALGAIALVEAARPLPARERVRLLLRRTGQIALAGLLALALVNAAYLFQGTLTPASAYEWKSASLRFLRGVPVPLFVPRVFALGLDLSAQIQEQPGLGRGYNYVLGALNADGRWYAFPLMVLLKTPLALFVLAALSSRAFRRPGGPGVLGAACLWAPALAVLGFYSVMAKPQLGIRYVLPVLPPLIVAAAGAAVAVRHRGLVLGLALWHAGSALSYHPHYMSYFNELIGARKNAWRFLADSNLDWEDRSADIARFRAANPGTEVVVNPREPRAGLLLVAANKLVGLHDPERYRWLREGFEPAGHVGYSYLVFRVSPARLREVLARPRPSADPALPPLPDPDRDP
jgi:hypothetical protein